MWIKIAKAGEQPTTKGGKITYSTSDMDKTIQKYNPTMHEAPVAVNNPNDSDPAMAWVEALRREGNLLYAKIKAVVPEFLDMLNKNVFARQTISLYPDLSLCRVGFYGPMPDIKGFSTTDLHNGGVTMLFEYDEKNDDPGEVLNKKVLEKLTNPPRCDRYGRPIDFSKFTYRDAFDMVCLENPELTERYIEQIRVQTGQKRK